jgi:hypothetical protein
MSGVQMKRGIITQTHTKGRPCKDTRGRGPFTSKGERSLKKPIPPTSLAQSSSL